MAVIACSRNRPTWHIREEADRHDGKASFFSKGNNKLMTNQVQKQRQDTRARTHSKPDAAPMIQVTGKPVATDKGQES